MESVTRGAFALFYGAAIKDFELSLKYGGSFVRCCCRVVRVWWLSAVVRASCDARRCVSEALPACIWSTLCHGALWADPSLASCDAESLWRRSWSLRRWCLVC